MPDEYYCTQCDYIFSAAESGVDTATCPACGAVAAKIGSDLDQFEESEDDGKYPADTDYDEGDELVPAGKKKKRSGEDELDDLELLDEVDISDIDEK